MAKNKFLLVDLNEKKTKKLANTITSDTSRKILSYLAEKDDTEANMSKELGMPISTVHYHLQKLQEAQLVTVDEFHYSKKGREVNHYKLANKYIIIAPKKVVGLKQKLREILPVGLIALGVSAVVKVATLFEKPLVETVSEAAPILKTVSEGARDAVVSSTAEVVADSLSSSTAEVIMDTVAPEVFMEAEPVIASGVEPLSYVTPWEPGIAFWVFVGALATVSIYAVYVLIKNRKR